MLFRPTSVSALLVGTPWLKGYLTMPDDSEGGEQECPPKRKRTWAFVFNLKLTSHSPQCYAVNLINGVPGIKTTWAMIAHGWQLAVLSTIFEYLDFNKDFTNQVA